MLIIEYTPLDYDRLEQGYRCDRCGAVITALVSLHNGDVATALGAHQRAHGALGYRIRPQSEDIA